MVSNELLDAFAVHRVVCRNDSLCEVYVGVDNGMLVEREGPPSTEELASYIAANEIKLVEGQTVEICLEVATWVAMVSRVLIEGFVLTVDYGAETSALYDPERLRESLVCQHRYQLNTEPLTRVGRQDITAHVDFGNLRRCGTLANCDVIGDVAWRCSLLGLERQRICPGIL